MADFLLCGPGYEEYNGQSDEKRTCTRVCSTPLVAAFDINAVLCLGLLYKHFSPVLVLMFSVFFLNVSVTQRATAESLAQALNEALKHQPGSRQFLAMPYHGKMTDSQRTEAQVTTVFRFFFNRTVLVLQSTRASFTRLYINR